MTTVCIWCVNTLYWDYQLNAEAKKKIAAAPGVTIHQLTPVQHKAWVKAMHPVWKKFENQIGKDVITAAVESNEAMTH